MTVSISSHRKQGEQSAIVRACHRTPEAMAWFAKHGITPPTENKLEVLDKGETSEIVLLGVVGESDFGSDGITEREVRNALKQTNGKPATVKLNSPGGSVTEGLGINSAFEEHGKVTVEITGCALSIASVFACGASRTVIPDNAIVMAHCAWSFSAGNASDKRKDADMLDKFDESLVGIYAKKTGRSRSEIKAMMDKETWFTGKEARAYGLGVAPEEKILNAASVPTAPGNGATPTSTASAQADAPQTQIAPITPGAVANNLNGTPAAQEPAAAVIGGTPTTPQHMPEITPAAATPPANDELSKVKAQLHNERLARVTDKVTRLAENKIKNDQIGVVINMAMDDEAKAYAFIESLPAAHVGASPLGGGGGIVILSENPLEKIKALKKPSERVAAMKEDWAALFADACARDTRKGASVMASNTYSSTLVTSFLLDGAITDLQNRWAALKCFTIDASTDPYKPKATAVLKHVTAGATTQTNATNFESGDSTVAPVSVTMAQYTQSFQVSNSDLQSGLRMENLVTINTANFANKIIEVATAPITVANFATTLVAGAGAFNFNDLATLQGYLKKSPIKNLILDGTYIARIANTPGFFQSTGLVGGDTGGWKAFGWDNIAQNTDWTGADTGVVGFACNPQAIQGVTGLPVTPPNIPGGILSQTTMTVPGLEIPIAVFTWFNPATRTMWTSYDIMAGFTAVDQTAGYIVKSS